jgi:hypothetical protein
LLRFGLAPCGRNLPGISRPPVAGRGRGWPMFAFENYSFFEALAICESSEKGQCYDLFQFAGKDDLFDETPFPQ